MSSDACRFSLIEHPAESNVVLDLMAEAADLLVAGQIGGAHARILAADIPSLCEWFHYEGQPTTKILKRHGIERSNLPTPPKELKTKGDATQQTKDFMFARDGWHCRFCGIRVLDPKVRPHLSRMFTDVRWGRRNLEKHACIAIRGSHDHVVPRQWGGANDENNLVSACWPCQFSRSRHRIEDCGLFDPRDRAPINDGWDGLRRVFRVRG